MNIEKINTAKAWFEFAHGKEVTRHMVGQRSIEDLDEMRKEIKKMLNDQNVSLDLLEECDEYFRVGRYSWRKPRLKRFDSSKLNVGKSTFEACGLTHDKVGSKVSEGVLTKDLGHVTYIFTINQ